MNKSYFAFIFGLLVIIIAIVAFAYSKSGPTPAKQTLPPPTILEASPATSSASTNQNAIPLIIKSPKDKAEVKSSFLSVEGITVPNADVSVNSKDLLSDADGKFKTTIILDIGENPLIVFASDTLGNTAVWEGTVDYESDTTDFADPTPEATPTTLVTPLTIAKVRGILESSSAGQLIMQAENNFYTINLAGSTRLVKRFGGKILVSDLNPGDELYVVGTFVGVEKNTVNALLVRNLSNKTRLTHFLTSIEKITPTQTFLLATGQTVSITSTTTLTNRLGEPLSLSHFRPQDKIKIWGDFNPVNQRVGKISMIANLVLPLTSLENR